MNFDVEHFLPYLLNRAAEQSSIGFQKVYRSEYGMLRTEWRVLFHLGRYDEMTAVELCKRGGLHKTKVSRAVHALEKKRYIKRQKLETDRRFETLSLTPSGLSVYKTLEKKAEEFHEDLVSKLTPENAKVLIEALKLLSDKSKGDK